MRFIFYILFLGFIVNSCKKNYKDCNRCSCSDVKPASGISEVDSLLIFKPTIFTPNGDGLNDLFRPSLQTKYLESIKFEVLSRNQNDVIYASTDLNGLWDGKDSEGNMMGERIFSWKLSGMTKWNKSFSLEGEVYLHKGSCYDKSALNCKFADQIAPSQGFVQPSAEKICN
jgi:gliding motility-associated-like protein